jgi:hypothetical protein
MADEIRQADGALARLTQWDALHRYNDAYYLSLSYPVAPSDSSRQISQGQLFKVNQEYAEFRHEMKDYGYTRAEIAVPYTNLRRSWFLAGWGYDAFLLQGPVRVERILSEADQRHLFDGRDNIWASKAFFDILHNASSALLNYTNPLSGPNWIKEGPFKYSESRIMNETTSDIRKTLLSILNDASNPKQKADELEKKISRLIRRFNYWTEWPGDRTLPITRDADGNPIIDWQSLLAESDGALGQQNGSSNPMNTLSMLGDISGVFRIVATGLSVGIISLLLWPGYFFTGFFATVVGMLGTTLLQPKWFRFPWDINDRASPHFRNQLVASG